MSNSIVNPLINPVLSDFDSHYSDLLKSGSVAVGSANVGSSVVDSDIDSDTSDSSTGLVTTCSAVSVSNASVSNANDVSVLNSSVSSKSSAIKLRQELAAEIVKVCQSGFLPNTQTRIPSGYFKFLSESTFAKLFSSTPNTIVSSTSSNSCSKLNATSKVSFHNDTLHSYLCHCAQNNSKVLVLNFANFKYPGGQFLKGTFSQEESLCHISNLYPALCASEKFYANCHQPSFYATHRQSPIDDLYNSDCMYLEDITLLKNLNGSFKKRLYTFDVLSMSAPNKTRYFARVDSSDALAVQNARSKYAYTLVFRIRHLCQLLCVLPNKYDAVVLGAFGCGHFGNDPRRVASIFASVLADIPYDRTSRFDKIDFVISDTDVFKAFKDGFTKPHLY